ncbi:MAG: MFS transporter [Candidatus Competibacteraceae bacterium]|nr:MFS transporter [Candidatus Competibacteraceae bacterium]
MKTIDRSLIRTLTIGLILLVTTLSFSALVVGTAFERLHEHAAIARLAAASGLLGDELNGLPAGDNWQGSQAYETIRRGWVRLNTALSKGEGLSAGGFLPIKSIALADTNGVFHQSTEYSERARRLPEAPYRKTLDRLGQSLGLEDVRYTPMDGDYEIMLPLGEGLGDRPEAWLAVRVDGRLIQGDSRFRSDAIIQSALLGLATGMTLLLAVGLWHWRREALPSPTWLLVGAVATAQLTAFTADAFMLRADYLDRLQERTLMAASLLDSTTRSHLERGGQLHSPDLAAQLQLHRQAFALDTLTVTQPDGNSAIDRAFDKSPGDFGPVAIPVEFNGQTVAWVQASASAGNALSQLVALLMEGLTAATLTLLLCVELVVFATLWLKKQAIEHKKALAPQPNHQWMRPAIFLFLFSIDLSMSILPLHAERLYEPLFGLSRNVVMGLPISAEFLCVGIAILACGLWVDRRGWREPFIWGISLALLGGLYSWLAPDVLHFILSRAVVGLGYGLTLLAAQGYVIAHTDAHSKGRGLAYLFAGLYAGSICGAATGSTLAERFGYETIFLSSVLILTATLFYAWFSLGKGGRPAAQSTPVPQSGGPGALRAFLTDRRVVSVILLSSLPASIAVVGFLNYFSPVYLDRLGAAESTTGQVLMLFGLSLALLGPAIGRYADGTNSRIKPIFIGSLLGALAFLSFTVLEGLAAATIAVILLGLSNSFVLSAQSAYILSLDVTQRLGQGKAMGIFRASSRIGQFLGPLLFATLIMSADLEDSVTYFGLAYLMAALLFLYLGRHELPSRPARTRQPAQENA